MAGARAAGRVERGIRGVGGRRPRRRTPTWFVVGFPLAIVAAGFWWAARLAAELVLEGDVVCERRLLGERRVPLADLTSVRPTAWSPNVAVFEVRGQRAVVTVGAKGLARFVDEIERRRPGLPVRFGWQTRRSERRRGRSHTTDR